jgi:hypothetical protein
MLIANINVNFQFNTNYKLGLLCNLKSIYYKPLQTLFPRILFYVIILYLNASKALQNETKYSSLTFEYVNFGSLTDFSNSFAVSCNSLLVPSTSLAESNAQSVQPSLQTKTQIQCKYLQTSLK